MRIEEKEGAIKLFNTVLFFGKCECTKAEVDKYLKMAIGALEQEPKTGHWIMTNDYLTTAYGSVDYVKCSCCHEDSLEEGDYCPNCGAKMEERRDKE